MKEYKEIQNNIEYHIIELNFPEDGKLRLKGKKLKEKAKEHLYTIVRKFDKDIFVKEMFFKDGMIHNMYGLGVWRPDARVGSFWLNDKKFIKDSEEYKNEIRKVRLDETLRD